MGPKTAHSFEEKCTAFLTTLFPTPPAESQPNRQEGLQADLQANLRPYLQAGLRPNLQAR